MHCSLVTGMFTECYNGIIFCYASLFSKAERFVLLQNGRGLHKEVALPQQQQQQQEQKKKACMPGSMSEFPTQDIFRQETGPFDEYNTTAISNAFNRMEMLLGYG